MTWFTGTIDSLADLCDGAEFPALIEDIPQLHCPELIPNRFCFSDDYKDVTFYSPNRYFLTTTSSRWALATQTQINSYQKQMKTTYTKVYGAPSWYGSSWEEKQGEVPEKIWDLAGQLLKNL